LLSARQANKMYRRYTLGLTMKFALKIFFLPGDFVADLIGATAEDDRMMIRTLIDMIFWNLVVVIGAVVIFR
jgi:hypothetical protein